MKTISAALQTHLNGECLTLATCWKVTRKDGMVLGFTDHNSDLEVESVSYSAATGFTPTSIASQASLAVDNLDVEGMLQAGSITEQDILAGRYDHAEIEVFMVNYADISQGTLALRKGWLGEIEVRNHQFVAEVRGLSQQLAQTIGDLYSPVCRARFGDLRCGVNRASYQESGTVSTVLGRSQFTDSSRTEAAETFTLGSVEFTSGANDGVVCEVKSFRDGRITLALPVPDVIEIGDSYTITQGCNKTFTTCTQRYNNAINFRGEPHVPGIDKMLETAGTRSE